MDEIRIIASFDTWERRLLEDFETAFLQDGQEPETPALSTPGHDVMRNLFERWCWATKLGNDISGLTSNTRSAHKKTQDVWALVQRWMSQNEAGYACHSRVSRLQQDNQTLEQQFRSTDFHGGEDEAIKSIIPHRDDGPLWYIVAQTMRCLPVEWRGLRSGEELHGRFSRRYILDGSGEWHWVTNEGQGGIGLASTVPVNIANVLIWEAQATSAQQGAFSSLTATSPSGIGTSSHTTAPLPVQLEGESGSADSDNLEGLVSFLALPRRSTAHDHGPQISQSSVDKSLLLDSLKSKLKTDDEAPTRDAALQRLSGRLAFASCWPQARERGDDETSASEHEVPEHDTTTNEGFKRFEIWSLVRMASSECRRQLRIPLQSEADNSASLRFQFPPGPSDDPRQWLEFIPLCELTSSKTGDGFLWRPQRRTRLDHHLFTEEEVLKYCVDNSFSFPEYTDGGDGGVGGAIVFVATKLAEARILGELDRLEELWNDSAITVDPSNGTWYVLETKPGKRFRQIEADFDIHVARSYFRRVVDQQRIGLTLELEDVLENTFEPNYSAPRSDLVKQYTGLINAIDFQEISICDLTPLGGQHQSVYKAMWKRRQAIDYPQSEPGGIPVVLKRLWPPGPDSAQSRGQEALFRELRLTLLVSARRPQGLNILHGLTRATLKNPSSGAQHPPGDCDCNEGDIFLVFEYAQSSLEAYFKDNLKGREQDWDIITRRFEDLARSIKTIHGEGIVHRDIHPGNIMIREQQYSRGLTSPSGLQLVLIDLGESRTLGTLEQSFGSYGYRDFRAPEVTSGRFASQASDIFSVGCAMIAVLGWGREAARARDPDGDDGRFLVPGPLQDLAWQCVNEDVGLRPVADELLDRVKEIIAARFRVQESGEGMVVFSRDEFVELRAREDSGGEEDEDSEQTEEEDGSEDEVAGV